MSDSDYDYVNIGLYAPTPGTTQQWTDGSSLNYTNWYYGYPSGSSGAYMEIDGRPSHSLNDGFWRDGGTVWRGICQL